MDISDKKDADGAPSASLEAFEDDEAELELQKERPLWTAATVGQWEEGGGDGAQARVTGRRRLQDGGQVLN